MPRQNFLLLAELKAFGVCPSKIYYFWHTRRHWVCAHAEFIAVLQDQRHWVCAQAKFITCGTTEGIGCVPKHDLILLAGVKALGVCPCKIYCFWHK